MNRAERIYIDFFNLIDNLNASAPAYLSFLTAVSGSYYGRVCHVLLHGEKVGEISSRSKFYVHENVMQDINISMSLDDSYNTRCSEQKSWKLTTKGIVPKILQVVEELLERSRKRLVMSWHQQQWKEITERDFSTLIQKSTKHLKHVESSSLTLPYSGVTLSAITPAGLDRQIFPRVYRIRLNGNSLFQGVPVPISNLTLNKVVRNLGKFENVMKEVLEDA